MVYTKKVIEILNNYENTNAGVKANLGRILMSGDLGGTGKLLILPVDPKQVNYSNHFSSKCHLSWYMCCDLHTQSEYKGFPQDHWHQW